MYLKFCILLFVLTSLVSSFTHHQNHYQSKIQHLSIQNNHQYRYRSSSSSGFGDIFAGFVIGPIMFFCSFICIWFNEKRAAIDARRLKLASQICQIVDVTSQQSAMSKDGKLVYATGQSRTSAIIADPLSSIGGPNLIKIKRVVEVLQWRRHTRRNGDYEEQTYNLQWVSTNSQNEGTCFNSPANWFIKNDITYNTQVYLGGYNVDKTTADLCNKTVSFSPSNLNAQQIVQNTKIYRNYQVSGQHIIFPSGTGQGQGTLRVSFLLTPTGPLTICARSTGATFRPFPIAQFQGTLSQNNGVPDCCCCIISSCYAELLKPIQQIHLVEQQHYTQGQMFDIAVKKSQCFTLGVRIGSYLCMVIGICLFFSPITKIIGMIPLVGGFVSGIVGFAILLAALLICIPLWIIATSFAWLFYHPKIGVAILLVGAVVLTLVLILGRQKDDGGSTNTASHFLSLRGSHT